MVLGIRTQRKGQFIGHRINTQLDTQASAVSAVAYTSGSNTGINPADTVITIATNSASYVLPQPEIGRLLVIQESGAAANGITVKCTVGTFDGTNNTATFNAATTDILVILGISATRWLILLNSGVSLSST